MGFQCRKFVVSVSPMTHTKSSPHPPFTSEWDLSPASSEFLYTQGGVHFVAFERLILHQDVIPCFDNHIVV